MKSDNLDFSLTLRGRPYYPRFVSQKSGSRRIWEIDFLRGLSIILVVGYHLLYDLGEFVGVERFFGFTTDLSTIAWSVAQHFFAGLFIVLSGTSSTLTRSNMRRGLKLLAVSLAVTAITYIFDSSSAVWFGILQLLAVSILVFGAAFEKAKPVTCAAWGVFVLGLGAVLHLLKKGMTIRFDWLLPFGIHRPGYSSFDYFPLIPWLGVFLIGAVLGKSVYAPRRSLLPWRLPQTFVNAAGRHSLLIYIFHQPVILAVLYVLGLMK
ncbi:MAG: DUF1624 domain-containing protein [Candidatus Aminicenantes bacterium]|nr:DUF1624 domain-containing protein [Candidatus Aminicenantes bacterium]